MCSWEELKIHFGSARFQRIFHGFADARAQLFANLKWKEEKKKLQMESKYFH